MKNNLWFKLSGAALLSLVLLGFAVPSGQTAPTVTLTALVQDQQCQGGDNVNVTLTATLNPPASNVRFQWDFNNDRIFDTPLTSNPTVSHLYPDEVNVTAVVKAVKGRRSATNSVTFQHLALRELVSASVLRNCSFSRRTRFACAGFRFRNTSAFPTPRAFGAGKPPIAYVAFVYRIVSDLE